MLLGKSKDPAIISLIDPHFSNILCVSILPFIGRQKGKHLDLVDGNTVYGGTGALRTEHFVLNNPVSITFANIKIFH